MILSSPGRVAFYLGPITVYWYGIIIALAFTIALVVITGIAKKQNENPDKILDLAVYLLIAGVVFARLYYIFFNWQYYSRNISEIFKIWYGGLSIHGALLGGFIVLVAYTRIYRLSLLKYADMFSYGVILAQAIGRWGNFFNSEAFGMPTNGPIKLYIPPESRPEMYQSYQYFHPTFLYESLWDLSVFLLLYFVLRRKFEGYNGVIFFSYLILYSVGRFIIEGLRVDSISFIFGLPLAQFISIILIITGICGLFFVFKRRSA